MMHIVLSLGSNLGDRDKNLAEARTLLGEYGLKILRASDVYETEPVGHEDQDYFLNQVLLIDTEKNPEELMNLCINAESEMGRKRGIKNGPRIIDIDILFYRDELISTDKLIIPHPELQYRRFILEPLASLVPKEAHPVLWKKMSVLLEECGDEHEVRIRRL